MEKRTIIESISNGITKVFSSVKRNGVLVCTWATFLFILLYSFVIHPIDVNSLIYEMNSKKEKVHEESVNKRLLADEAIPILLDNFRMKHDLRRVCILELHNTTSNINGVSFLYFSMTYESFDADNDSIESVGYMYQSQRTSEYYQVFNDMGKKGYICYDNLKENNFYGIRFLKNVHKNGSDSIMIIPIMKDGRINALLVLSSEKGTMNYKDIGEDLYKPVLKIKEMLL